MTANRKLTALRRTLLHKIEASHGNASIDNYRGSIYAAVNWLVTNGYLEQDHQWLTLTALGRAAIGTSDDAEPQPFDGRRDAGATTRNYIVKVALRDGETKGTISAPDGLNGNDLYATLVTVAQKQFGDNFHYIRTYYDADDPGRTPYPDTWEHGTVRDAQTAAPATQHTPDVVFDELMKRGETLGNAAVKLQIELGDNHPDTRKAEGESYRALLVLAAFIEQHADTIRAALASKPLAVGDSAYFIVEHEGENETGGTRLETISAAVNFMNALLADNPDYNITIRRVRRIDGGGVQR